MRSLTNHVFLLLFIGLISCNSEKQSKSATTPEIDSTKTTVKRTIGEAPFLEISSDVEKKILNFNEQMLSDQIIQLVNDERVRLRLNTLEKNELLRKAAKLQNDYILSTGKLTHEGGTLQTKDLRSRVSMYGGSFNILAENVAMRSYNINRQSENIGIERYTYQIVADHFFSMWKESPGHYANMINPDLQYISVAADWSPDENAIYATQVFGK